MHFSLLGFLFAISMSFFSNIFCYIPSYYKGSSFYTVNFEQNELPLTVIICTYNNAKWYDKNLQSIFDQKYSNYRVIIIDDFSNDGTADLIEKYIIEKKQEHRCKLIRNSQRSYKMSNLYKAVHSCKNDEIVVEFDGDDWFLDDRVFSYLNELYSSADVWLTYGGYQEYPSGKPGFCRQIPTEVIDANSFRSYYRTTSQQRTFYAGLFKSIPLEDLIFEGKFFPVTSDVAQMMPMFEMAGNRIAYNYRKLYVYNLANVINDHKVDPKLQTRANDYVLNRRKLTVIENIFKLPEDVVKGAEVDVIIYNEKPEHLIKNLRFLTNLKHKLSVTVVFTNYLQHKDQYLAIHNEFPEIPMVMSTEMLKIISELKSDYIFFMNDTSIVTSQIDLNKCVRNLEKTQAHALFYKGLGFNKNDFSSIEKDVFVMQFGQKNSSENYPFTCDMSLFRKKDIIPVLRNIQNCHEDLEKKLNQVTVRPNTVALLTL